MYQIIKLLLPALMPSWRFFDRVTASPRIEFTCLETLSSKARDSWQELHPRPLRLSFLEAFKRMFWNPHWNEYLFLTSCAERLMNDGSGYNSEHSAQQIADSITKELKSHSTHSKIVPYFQFRLVFIDRNGADLQKHIMFISKIYSRAPNSLEKANILA